MRHINVRRTLAAAVFVVAAMIGSAAAVTASAAAAPFCGITWGSLPKANETFSSSALINVRTGQHDCFDRVVFDFSGPATGYRVQYRDHIFTQAKGDELPVAGGAKLEVVLFEPAYDINTGALTYPYGFAGDRLPNVAGFRTLRDVEFGGSFEGYTTIGVGVRARLPFRMFTLAGPGGHSRIVLDIARRWS